MTFQFTCPQGHLLSGEENQAGQHCNCPQCGMLFVIPAPAHEPEPAFPGFGPGQSTGGGVLPTEPRLLHIPCPNGHELETPPEMLEQEVMCPHCGVQFRLRERDSAEYKRARSEERERRERKMGNAWFNWAIVIAVLVVIGLIALIATSQ